MITEQGLREQLLAIVVANERPDLQEKKEQLIIESARNRDALYTIESQILEVSPQIDREYEEVRGRPSRFYLFVINVFPLNALRSFLLVCSSDSIRAGQTIYRFSAWPMTIQLTGSKTFKSETYLVFYYVYSTRFCLAPRAMC